MPPRHIPQAGQQESKMSRRPLGLVTLRTFRNNSGGLPAPLAFARLNNRVSFFADSDHPHASNQIALRTTFGEKWIAVDIELGTPQGY
jgi:hypothetical protein